MPYLSSALRTSQDVGDPFLHRRIGRLAGRTMRGFGGAVSGFFRGGPVAAVRGGVRGFTQSRKPPSVFPGTGRSRGILPGGLKMPSMGPDGLPRKRSRRMNPANGRANRRAIRRLKGGEKYAKELLRAIGYRQISKSTSKRGHQHARAATNVVSL